MTLMVISSYITDRTLRGLAITGYGNGILGGRRRLELYMGTWRDYTDVSIERLMRQLRFLSVNVADLTSHLRPVFPRRKYYELFERKRPTHWAEEWPFFMNSSNDLVVTGFRTICESCALDAFMERL